jgi:hypothetical protein
VAIHVRGLASSRPAVRRSANQAEAAGVEVDRIWRIDGLDGQANPAWQNSARRRRKFVEEVAAAEEPSDTNEEESAAQEQPPEQDRRSFPTSDEVEAAASADSGASFRVIA